jgi:hypothetical protein
MNQALYAHMNNKRKMKKKKKGVGPEFKPQYHKKIKCVDCTETFVAATSENDNLFGKIQ